MSRIGWSPEHVEAAVELRRHPAARRVHAIDVAVTDVAGRTIDYVERVISFTARNVAPEGSDDQLPVEHRDAATFRPELDLDGRSSHAAIPVATEVSLDATKGRVLYAGQSYYNTWYLSRALRKLGWRADVLNWDTNSGDAAPLPR